MPVKAFPIVLRPAAAILLACQLCVGYGAVRPALAGFRSPESVVRNVYAYYGDRSSELSSGLPHDAATAVRFFSPRLRESWLSATTLPFDFFVQSSSWKLGGPTISIIRRQFDKTYVAAGIDNQGRRVTLNFIVIDGPEGWLIDDVESPHDSLSLYLTQHRR